MPKRSGRTIGLLAASLAFALLVPGCRSAYYGAMEQLGWEKRHLLADRVEEARDEQEAARAQFETTLKAFKAVTGFEGGDLEAAYGKLQREYERSETRAEAVTDRVDAVERVAGDLLDEWEAEIDQMRDPGLRRGSEARLRETRARYRDLISAMRRAEGTMEPVLTAFRDRVLYLKHNLNARAIASLEGELGEIETDVARLVRDVGASIAEAESFLKTLEE